MSRSPIVTLPLVVTLLAACGGPSGGEVKSPTPEGTMAAAASTAAPTSTAAAAPEGTAAPDSTSAPKTAAPNDKGPYGGVNPGVKVALTGEEAWTLGPYPDYSDQLGSYQFVRSEGTRNVFYKFASKDEFSMPAAFTFKPTGQKVKKGDRVFATIVTSGVCARVTDVKDDRANIVFYWGDKPSKRDEMDVAKLLVLDGTLGFAAPVVWENAEEGDDPESRTTEHGHLVYKDDKDAYLTFDKKMPVKAVRAVNVSQPFKAGDKVLASPFDVSSSLQRGTVVKALEDGLGYEVKLDDAPKETTKVSYCDIIPAPKAAKKK